MAKTKFMAFMVGNVGAGKTTKSKQIVNENENTIYISLDEIGDAFEKENGYHDNEKLSNRINGIAFSAIEAGKNIIVDGNLLTRQNRITKRFKMLARAMGYKIECYDFGPGLETQLERRVYESPEKSEQEWRIIFEQKKNSYEKPTLDEGFDEIIEV